MIKLLLSWDILPDHDQQFFEFLIREFAPRLTAMGIKPIEAWLTLYGSEGTPQIVIEAIADNLEKMREILATDEWQSLRDDLSQHATNFTQKVIRGRPYLQL